jgi:hypothetical protein
MVGNTETIHLSVPTNCLESPLPREKDVRRFAAAVTAEPIARAIAAGNPSSLRRRLYTQKRTIILVRQ